MGRHLGVERCSDEFRGVISVRFLSQFLVLFQKILEFLPRGVEMKLFPFAAGCGNGLGSYISSSECRNDVFQAGTVCVSHFAVGLKGVIPE